MHKSSIAFGNGKKQTLLFCLVMVPMNFHSNDIVSRFVNLSEKVNGEKSISYRYSLIGDKKRFLVLSTRFHKSAV